MVEVLIGIYSEASPCGHKNINPGSTFQPSVIHSHIRLFPVPELLLPIPHPLSDHLQQRSHLPFSPSANSVAYFKTGRLILADKQGNVHINSPPRFLLVCSILVTFQFFIESRHRFFYPVNSPIVYITRQFLFHPFFLSSLHLLVDPQSKAESSQHSQPNSSSHLKKPSILSVNANGSRRLQLSHHKFSVFVKQDTEILASSISLPQIHRVKHPK